MTPQAYAHDRSLRFRQQLKDASTLAWIGAWGYAGRALYRTVEHLRSATRGAQGAGNEFARRLDSVARTVTDVPLVGDALRRPFAGAADAGRSLESAGAAAGDTLHTLALWLGLVVALVPISWILARYLPPRIAWMREAGAASGIRIETGDLHLFALRAAATAPLHELRKATSDPAAALERGDYAALAAIELRRLGLRAPSTA